MIARIFEAEALVEKRGETDPRLRWSDNDLLSRNALGERVDAQLNSLQAFSNNLRFRHSLEFALFQSSGLGLDARDFRGDRSHADEFA
ncbi:hypothetical protein LB506_008861 [Fusarium annulatum]|nr:hypothetical protein LB506_008861 [Fusarium annulatum]